MRAISLRNCTMRSANWCGRFWTELSRARSKCSGPTSPRLGLSCRITSRARLKSRFHPFTQLFFSQLEGRLFYYQLSCALLSVQLNQPPLFYREINPQPRKHTLWQQASDFTGGQAPVYRYCICRILLQPSLFHYFSLSLNRMTNAEVYWKL